ncbi:MAG TPA: ASCH domain-containing protein [Candidatus Riflebacteria bacterium]|nr:ASCH domain-containing protein [Candidatus Riflebacteria bacterium]
MKALSVVEMPGTAIACGRKTLEIRHWRPGELPLLNLLIVQNKRRLTTSDPVDPEGKVVAIVDVRNIRDWKEDDLEASCSSTWEPGWLAWELENVRRVIDGPRVPAMRRIYDVDLYIDDLRTE